MRVRKSFSEIQATLYVCSTPIGNLQDVTHRLLATLREVDVVAAEDTRQTRKLLSKFDIHPPQVVSFHEHNAEARSGEFAAWWTEGKSIAIVSDAGTPGISDPGMHAIEKAIMLGIPVVPVPGPSAVLAALIGSGLPLQPFTFIGFLPRTEKLQRAYLKPYTTLPSTLVFYEAPHRLAKTLAVLKDMLQSHRRASLAKELTKRYETFVDGTLEELYQYAITEDVRGEYVVVVEGLKDEPKNVEDAAREAELRMRSAVQEVRLRLQGGMHHTQAVREVATELGVKRKLLYQLSLAK